METKKDVFYEQVWFMWVMILFVFPVGLYLMFKYQHHTKPVRIVITTILAFVVLVVLVTDDEEGREGVALEEIEEEVPEEINEEEIEEANNNEIEEEFIEEEMVEEVIEEENGGSDKQANIETMEFLLAASFEGSAETGYDEESGWFYMFSDDRDFARELVEIMNGTRDRSEWDTLVEGTRTTSEIITDIMEDDGYGMVVLNPEDRDRVIIMAVDGYVLYDMLEE